MLLHARRRTFLSKAPIFEFGGRTRPNTLHQSLKVENESQTDGFFNLPSRRCLVYPFQMKQQQLADIASELQKERDVVARYKQLKFV